MDVQADVNLEVGQAHTVLEKMSDWGISQTNPRETCSTKCFGKLSQNRFDPNVKSFRSRLNS